MEYFRRGYQEVASRGRGRGSARHSSSAQTGEHIHRRGTGTLGQGPPPVICWGFMCLCVGGFVTTSTVWPPTHSSEFPVPRLPVQRVKPVSHHVSHPDCPDTCLRRIVGLSFLPPPLPPPPDAGEHHAPPRHAPFCTF